MEVAVVAVSDCVDERVVVPVEETVVEAEDVIEEVAV